MQILVCVKQVPDTSQVKLDPKTNRLQRAGVPNILNPFDEHAVEEALALKDSCGATVTVITMGPPQAKEVLKECLAKGCDHAYLISDRAFGGADTLATAYTLATAIRTLGTFDLIFCGKQAIDGDTAQVGAQIAEMLDWPQVSGAVAFTLKGTTAQIVREHEDGYETIEVELPVLVTTTKHLNTPRYPSLRGLIAARTAEIKTLTAADLPVEPERIGMAGSPTQVRRVYTPQGHSHGEIFADLPEQQAVQALLAKLKKRGFQRQGAAQ